MSYQNILDVFVVLITGHNLLMGIIWTSKNLLNVCVKVFLVVTGLMGLALIFHYGVW